MRHSLIDARRVRDKHDHIRRTVCVTETVTESCSSPLAVSCAVQVVSALVMASSVVLLAPVLVAVAGALGAAIVLTVTGTRSGDPLPH